MHTASRGTYGSRRVHAELTRGMDVVISGNLVAVLMSRSGFSGLPGPAKVRVFRGVATADDLVHRKLHRLAPHKLWVIDNTEHPTRKGVPAAAVLDAFSRRIAGRSIDNHQDTSMVVNALHMGIKNRWPTSGGNVHADHGVQFTSRANTGRIREANLMPSRGTIGDGYDNAMMESF